MPKTKTPEVRPHTRKPIPVETRPELPKWVNKTPEEHSHSLVAYCPYDGDLERVELTRAEYIFLKQCLAGYRGWDVPADAMPNPDAA